MAKWEYYTVWVGKKHSGLRNWHWQISFSDAEYAGSEGIRRFLNEMGQKGWELVSIIPSASTDGITAELGIFMKRPLP